ncbi:MAG TPA: prolipoprotein diacylglyceryl transferase family protein [Actinomycetota bacterium]|nr:prolipoprotein diacylglyceryl transferase family protein [Actinomycetota bacterium]
MISLLGTIGWPVLDRIHLFGDFAISPHGLGIAVGVLFGAWIWSVEGPKRGVTVDHINTMLFWVLVGAIVGARLFWVIGHWSELEEPLDALRIWEGGISLLGGIAGAVLVNIPNIRRYGYSFFQVLDGAVMGLAFGIAFGRIGDLIIGDHLGKPTSWLLAWQYGGGTPAGFSCVADMCRTTLQGGKELMLTTTNATLSGPGGEQLGAGTGVHQTALYDMILVTLLFLLLYLLSRSPRRLGVLTLTFGAWYGATRVLEDFLRVDKRFFGMTGSQWTGLTVSIVCLTTLAIWAIRARSRPREPDALRADAPT